MDDHKILGEYTVEVIADGYRRWLRRGVEVESEGDGCPMETVELEALLQPGDSGDPRGLRSP